MPKEILWSYINHGLIEKQHPHNLMDHNHLMIRSNGHCYLIAITMGKSSTLDEVMDLLIPSGYGYKNDGMTSNHGSY
jgi:hypothetical protein